MTITKQELLDHITNHAGLDVSELAADLSSPGVQTTIGTRYCSVIGCMSVTFYGPDSVEVAA